MRLITIEFLDDTTREEVDPETGDTIEVPVRSKGDRVSVDPASAKSLVEVKRVARRVGSTKDEDRSAERVPVTGRSRSKATGDQPGEPAADAVSAPGADG